MGGSAPSGILEELRGPAAGDGWNAFGRDRWPELFRLLAIAADLPRFAGNRTLDDVKNLPGARDLFLSAGALTKHVQAIDLSLRLG